MFWIVFEQIVACNPILYGAMSKFFFIDPTISGRPHFFEVLKDRLALLPDVGRYGFGLAEARGRMSRPNGFSKTIETVEQCHSLGTYLAGHGGLPQPSRRAKHVFAAFSDLPDTLLAVMSSSTIAACAYRDAVEPTVIV